MNEKRNQRNKRTTTRGGSRNGKNSSKQMRGRTKFKDTEFESGTHTSGTNDIAWYSKNIGLLNSVANLSFGSIQGYDIGSTLSTDIVSPGVMAIQYVSGPGAAFQESDAVNVAAHNIFAQIRKYNSGSANYGPNDFMVYQLLMGEAYAWHSYLTRAYGTLQLYNVDSGYAPRTIVEAEGFDFDDLTLNMAALRGHINIFAAELNKFAVPKAFDYFTRQYWLPKGLYTDANTKKHQIYLFRPVGYRTYDYGDGAEVMSRLKFKPFPKTLMKLDDIVQVSRDILDSIFSYEDISTMSGDVRKAGIPCWELGNLADEYTVLPVHDYTVLAQIENLTVMGAPKDVDPNEFSITTKNNLGESLVMFKPQFRAAIMNYDEVSSGLDPRQLSKVLNAHVDNTDPSFVMESTRLCAMVDDTNTLCTMGTEFVIGLAIHYGLGVHAKVATVGCVLAEDGTDGLADGYPVINANIQDAIYDAFKFLELAYKFDWCPQIVTCSYVDMEGYGDIELFVELENYTIVDEKVLNNIHYCALLSLFDVVNTSGQTTGR